jgi:hypothetical protein
MFAQIAGQGHRKHRPSIVVEACLPPPLHSNHRSADHIESIVLCVRVCCGRYLATAHVYSVTA